MNLRTDLALESVYTHHDEGIVQSTEERKDIRITRIDITTKKAAEAVGKPMGKFVTLEGGKLREKSPETVEEIAQLLSEELKKMLPEEQGKILVVGLGNRSITPDALGPFVTERVMVTAHAMSYLNHNGENDFSPVGAVAPGVMGITGMETVEMIRGIVSRYQPSVVIAVDALCAASAQRMFYTVQLTDTGIHPGSGVGNRREGLNKETLGVPVIAVGIPTVVDSNAIVYGALERFFDANNSLEEAQTMMQGMMQYAEQGMFVSPKEVDSLISQSARIVAGGINLALHRDITLTFAENFVL